MALKMAGKLQKFVVKLAILYGSDILFLMERTIGELEEIHWGVENSTSMRII